MKITKTKIALSIALLSITGLTQAQWAVTNVNDPLYFGPTGIFTQLTGQMQNTLKASVDQVSAMTDLFRKQQNQLQEDTDVRNRAAMGYQAMAQHNMTIMPTLEACAALSKKAVGAASVSTSLSGGSAGGGGNSATQADASKIVSEQVKQTEMLNKKTALGTCGVNDKGVAGCSGSPGQYGGNSKQLSGDVSSLSIKTNMKNSDRLDPENQDFANFTLDAQGFDVAKQYVRNATYYNAPTAMTADQLSKNPGYKSIYDSIVTKLNGAYQAMLDVASTRKQGKPLDSNSVAGKIWNESKGDYQSLFGMKAPDNPSLTELMNFTTFNDYFGVPKNTAEDETALLKELNNKVALNNLISYKVLTQLENLNITQALSLTQQTTPVNIESAKGQYSQTGGK